MRGRDRARRAIVDQLKPPEADQVRAKLDELPSENPPS
jgi:hypothetical protein